MKEFPQDIKREVSMALLKENQIQLLKEERKKITNQIIEDTKESKRIFKLKLDERLDNEHRKTIAIELLHLFDNLFVLKSNDSKSRAEIEISITNENQIIDDISYIKIVT